MLWTLLLGLLCADSAAACSSPGGPAARLPGDVMIGGLFPLHMGVSTPQNDSPPLDFNCTGFDFVSVIQALSMIYTIEQINNSTLLPGITLGYEMYDTCSSVSKAMESAMGVITEADSSNESTTLIGCNKYEPDVKAVVGERYSEISASVSQLLSLYLIPQVSYASSASILNNTVKYRSFLRTVPSDIHQTRALAKLVSVLQWNWVGIIYSNDDYGRSALESLSVELEKQSVCIAFKELIQYNVNDPTINSQIHGIIDKLENTSSAKVIFVISRAPSLLKLFAAFIKHNVTKIWIASDAWATSAQVSGLENIQNIGPILGFSFRKGFIDGFTDYLQNLQPPPKGTNSFMEEYKELRFGCTEEYATYKNCTIIAAKHCSASAAVEMKSPLACSIENVSLANDAFLLRYIHNGTSYSVHLAVTAIAQAIHDLACENGTCKDNFPPYQLLAKLKEMQFSVPAGNFSFGNLGFLNGYDLIHWKMTDDTITFQTVGKYVIPEDKITIIESIMPWESKDKIPFSNCSQQCNPGYVKEHSTISCCYRCVPCTEGYYSPDFDLNVCSPCPNYQWSNNGSAKCEDRTIQFFGWANPFAIVLACFSALGLVAVLAIGILFLKHLSTPAVKAAGGVYSFVLGVSLLFSFMSTFFFIGEPTDTTCQIRQAMYGISFTLCISCVLLKSLLILLAFKLGKVGKSEVRVTYQPALFIVLVTTIQIVICVAWLLLNPPTSTSNYSMPKIALLQCSEGSYLAFGFMLGYSGLLAFVCFVVAYKGRTLPDKYNEARFITFSMLIYLFIWISFIPIYVTAVGVYFPAVQMVAILASNYGITCCHLLPACYVVFFKRGSNTRAKYQESIRNHHKTRRAVFSVSKFINEHQVNCAGSQDHFPLRYRHLSAVSFATRKRHMSV
ncbi:G-protein coupled receptor family C group 6 member A-like [Ambystoma mexicanum]|uniref:G-protein coupled receptor family C group 6 member A-like n=1 Tax=Ambystoma mexicanum TaxID=8296 RepID=UPI0037E72B80